MLVADDLDAMPVTLRNVNVYRVTVAGMTYRIKTNLKPQDFTDARYFRTEDALIAFLRSNGEVLH